MTDKPVPMNLDRYAELIGGSQEFLRVWAKKDGPVTCFVNPAALGADPFLFGMAMVDCVRHAAKAYARAVNVDEEEALARIWEGLDAERDEPTTDPISITAKKDMN